MCCWYRPQYPSSSPSTTLLGLAGSSLSIIRDSNKITSFKFRNSHIEMDFAGLTPFKQVQTYLIPLLKVTSILLNSVLLNFFIHHKRVPKQDFTPQPFLGKKLLWKSGFPRNTGLGFTFTVLKGVSDLFYSTLCCGSICLFYHYLGTPTHSLNNIRK